MKKNEMNTLEFCYKGLSRVFVFNKSDVEVVKDIIKRENPDEYIYLPADLITVWKGHLDDLVYNGKFDVEITNLIQLCANRGVGILVRTKPSEQIEL